MKFVENVFLQLGNTDDGEEAEVLSLTTLVADKEKDEWWEPISNLN